MIERAISRLVAFAARRAWATTIVILALAAAAGFYATRHLGMDTDTSRMIASSAPWRTELDRVERLFPQNSGLLVIVIDAADSGSADAAADRLFAEMQARPDLFRELRRPDGGDFWTRNGILFLPVADVQAIADSTLRAQPFIAALQQDPSLRGLFATLTLTLEGVAQGAADPQSLERPLALIADSLAGDLAGKPQPLAWSTLLSDGTPRPGETRRLILAQPNRDFADLQPGRAAIAFVRQTAGKIAADPQSGLRIRLTGPVALNDEEFATVADGMGIALAVSIALVLGLLFLALRSFKLIFASFLTLMTGLILTAAFAALAIGTLNLVSVAFAVIFIGIAIDFSIQFGVRYRASEKSADMPARLAATGRFLARPLALAALAIACGFAAFIPTDYRGVSELGIIACAGMGISLLLNLTLLPALIAILRPTAASASEPGLGWLWPWESRLYRHRRWVLAASGLAFLLGLASLPYIRFDFHPLHLKDPKSESVATLVDLMRDPYRSPYYAEILAPDPASAQLLAEQIRALPEVARVVDIESFVPKDQEEKLAILADLAGLMELSFAPAIRADPPSDADIRRAFADCAAKLRRVLPQSPAAIRLADLLDRAEAANPALYPQWQADLVGGLAPMIARLRLALAAAPIARADLPDTIARDWVAADGTYRLAVFPAGDSNDSAILARFVDIVTKLAPMATGPAIQIYRSGEAVAASFRFALLAALIAVGLLLVATLRKARDIAHALAPLLLAGSLVILYCAATDLAFDFANVIALPLLLGIGIAFDIYFAIYWRRGEAKLFSGAIAHAVLYSALTTAASFGALALSSHPGTARMGELLLAALAIELAAIFVFMPALMGPPRRE